MTELATSVIWRDGVSSFKSVTDVDLEALSDPATGEPLPNFVYIDDARITTNTNLIAIGRRDQTVHRLLKALAAEGYLHYWSVKGTSRFVHRSHVPALWNSTSDTKVEVSREGVIYTLKTPPTEVRVKRLLVILSGIHANQNLPSLWRYFEQNYKHLDGLVPHDTAILRIADLGGVVGAFYSDTVENPRNRENVSQLINNTVTSLGISKENVCLLGSSKGATGAVLHGLHLDMSFVAVDPVLGDQHYESRGDLHFTGLPVFPESKEELFSRVVVTENRIAGGQSVLFTSPGSEQHDIVVSYAKQLQRPILLVDVADPRIKTHPQVAKSVLGPTVSAVNSILLGNALPMGSFEY